MVQTTKIRQISGRDVRHMEGTRLRTSVSRPECLEAHDDVLLNGCRLRSLHIAKVGKHEGSKGDIRFEGPRHGLPSVRVSKPAPNCSFRSRLQITSSRLSRVDQPDDHNDPREKIDEKQRRCLHFCPRESGCTTPRCAPTHTSRQLRTSARKFSLRTA